MKPTKPTPPSPPWRHGQSGNPKGRPRGSVNPSTRLRQLIDVEPILRGLQAAAEAGDVQAARTLLERALPVYRTSMAPVELPALAQAATLPARASAILAAIADGELPADVGATLLRAAVLAEPARGGTCLTLEQLVAASMGDLHDDD